MHDGNNRAREQRTALRHLALELRNAINAGQQGPLSPIEEIRAALIQRWVEARGLKLPTANTIGAPADKPGQQCPGRVAAQ
jgi:hypothetical protein